MLRLSESARCVLLQLGKKASTLCEYLLLLQGILQRITATCQCFKQKANFYYCQFSSRYVAEVHTERDSATRRPLRKHRHATAVKYFGGHDCDYLLPEKARRGSGSPQLEMLSFKYC